MKRFSLLLITVCILAVPGTAATLMSAEDMNALRGGCNDLCYNSKSCSIKKCNPGVYVCFTCYDTLGYQDKYCDGEKSGSNCETGTTLDPGCGAPFGKARFVNKVCPGTGWCEVLPGDNYTNQDNYCTQRTVKSGSISCTWIP